MEVELRFSTSGHIRLDSLAGSTVLTLRQIRQMKIVVTRLEGFDWYAYLYAYEQERKTVLWANRWMGCSLIPFRGTPSWNLELITVPPLMPAVCQMMFLFAQRKPVVILASETPLTMNPILSAVMNCVLPGIITDPRDATWMLYHPQESEWARMAIVWEQHEEWWWATESYADPLSPEDVDNIIFKGGLP